MGSMEHLLRAKELICRGGVVACPTEAVWGLSCDPYSSEAVEEILRLKNCDRDKGLILIAAEMSQLECFLDGLSPSLLSVLQRSWPGPYTWLIPDNGTVPLWIRGRHSTVAVRVSAHPEAAALCRLTGRALVSTSANRSGEPPARSEEQVRQIFGTAVHIVPGATGGRALPTQIRDLCNGHILRHDCDLHHG